MSKKTQRGFSTLELLVILVVVGLLLFFVGSKFNKVRQNSRDEQRKADIVSLQESIDSYFAQNGKYPTLTQLNNSAFRVKNLPRLVGGSLQDPKWSPANKACGSTGQPSLQGPGILVTGCYGYASAPPNCDNKAINCNGYTLTAKLEGGGYYVKKI